MKQLFLYKDSSAKNRWNILDCWQFTSPISNYSGTYVLDDVTIKNETFKIFLSSQVSNNQGDSPDIDEDIQGSRFAIQDPSDEPLILYTESGTRIEITHTVSNGTGYVRIKAPSLFDGENYIPSSVSAIPNICSRQYDPTSQKPFLAAFYSEQMIGRDPVDNARVWPEQGFGTVYILNIVLINTTSGTWDSGFANTGVISENILTMSANGDDKPYKPTDNKRAGGRGIGEYHGATNGERPNVADRNGVTTFGGSGQGLTWYRLPSVSRLHDILGYAYGLGSTKDNSYVRASLISAYILPTLTIKTRIISGVRIADRTYNSFAPTDLPEVLDVEHISEARECSYDMEEIDGYGDFLDFTKTKFTLFLPFVGSVNIDTSAFQWGTLTVRYIIDVYNGNIVYWVYTKCIDSKTDQLYGTYSGNCAIQIPLTGVAENGSVLGKITNTVSNLAVGAASIAAGNPLGVLGAAQGMINSLTPSYSVDRAGAVDTSGAALDGWRISLKISMPQELQEGTSTLIGRPSFFMETVEKLPAGKHICQGVRVDGIQDATDGEKQKIKQILEGGFYR